MSKFDVKQYIRPFIIFRSTVKMAKLVGVYHDDTDAGRAKPNCLARRQLPLTIESDLTMIMALDDACLACR